MRSPIVIAGLLLVTASASFAPAAHADTGCGNDPDPNACTCEEYPWYPGPGCEGQSGGCSAGETRGGDGYTCVCDPECHWNDNCPHHEPDGSCGVGQPVPSNCETLVEVLTEAVLDLLEHPPARDTTSWCGLVNGPGGP